MENWIYRPCQQYKISPHAVYSCQQNEGCHRRKIGCISHYEFRKFEDRSEAEHFYSDLLDNRGRAIFPFHDAYIVSMIKNTEKFVPELLNDFVSPEMLRLYHAGIERGIRQTFSLVYLNIENEPEVQYVDLEYYTPACKEVRKNKRSLQLCLSNIAQAGKKVLGYMKTKREFNYKELERFGVYVHEGEFYHICWKNRVHLVDFIQVGPHVLGMLFFGGCDKSILSNERSTQFVEKLEVFQSLTNQIEALVKLRCAVVLNARRSLFIDEINHLFESIYENANNELLHNRIEIVLQRICEFCGIDYAICLSSNRDSAKRDKLSECALSSKRLSEIRLGAGTRSVKRIFGRDFIHVKGARATEDDIYYAIRTMLPDNYCPTNIWAVPIFVTDESFGILVFLNSNEVTGVDEGEKEELGIGKELLLNIRNTFEQKIKLLVHRIDARRAKQQREQLLADRSHDIVKHVQRIVGSAELLRKYRMGQLSGSIDKCVEDLLQNSMNVRKEVENIFNDAVEHWADVMTLHIETIRLRSMVNTVTHSFKTTFNEKKLKYNSYIDKEIVMAVDRYVFHNVMNNLLDNAYKYSKRNSEIDVEIFFRKHVRRHSLIIRVENEGLKIPMESKEIIFEEKVRLEEAKAFFKDGDGLGLYNCRRLLRRHDCKIELIAHKEDKNTFEVEIPAKYLAHNGSETVTKNEGTSFYRRAN